MYELNSREGTEKIISELYDKIVGIMQLKQKENRWGKKCTGPQGYVDCERPDMYVTGVPEKKEKEDWLKNYSKK